MSEPVHYDYWDEDDIDNNTPKTDFILVSGVFAYSGPETYIFPANKEGNVIGWGEMDGSFRGSIDHEEALTNAGYKVK